MPQKFGDGRGWRFWSVFLGAASLDQSALITATSSNQSLVAVDPQHEAEILTIWYKASTHNLIHHTPLHVFNFFHFLSNCSTLTPGLIHHYAIGNQIRLKNSPLMYGVLDLENDKTNISMQPFHEKYPKLDIQPVYSTS